MGYGLVNVFIDPLYTRLRTASNYSAIATLNTLQDLLIVSCNVTLTFVS
jgi:hypothetical protein